MSSTIRRLHEEAVGGSLLWAVAFGVPVLFWLALWSFLPGALFFPVLGLPSLLGLFVVSWFTRTRAVKEASPVSPDLLGRPHRLGSSDQDLLRFISAHLTASDVHTVSNPGDLHLPSRSPRPLATVVAR